MQSRSISREIALFTLGQITKEKIDSKDIHNINLDEILHFCMDTLLDHWRQTLDTSSIEIEKAQQHLIDTELKEFDKNSIDIIRDHLNTSLNHSQEIINNLSDNLELSKLLFFANQDHIKADALDRVSMVLNNINSIDKSLNHAMEGWRLQRLPRIDQDILRLAFVDYKELKTPIAVTCSEAVNLANRYSDNQGRKMINGILRRLQTTLEFTHI